MNGEFFDALYALEKEKGIPVDYLLEKISTAIGIAVKRDMGGTDDNIVEIDPLAQRFYVAVRKYVVDDVTDPQLQLSKAEASKYSKTAQVGDLVEIPLETKEFGRIAAQAAKHVIRQGISEAEKGQLLKKFQSKKFEIISALVLKVDPIKGNATLEIDKNEAILPKAEQVPGEVLVEGSRVMIYVVDVTSATKGPKMMISRTHPGLIKRLFEMETPEIQDGTVEIKAVSREAGSRTKIAVYSKDENVDPVGACIGPKGSRVTAIVDELGGEKIDVVKYSDDPAEFIAAALSPSQVISVEIDPEGARACKVTVPDNQLSLAIGNKGQNARLSARLTGWKIDIRPESGVMNDTRQG
ncbi:MAG: transcription termination factor NusA [Oscillospiraceae bacterium]